MKSWVTAGTDAIERKAGMAKGANMTKTGTIKGKVVDTHKRAMSGAEIRVEGTHLVAIAGLDGDYSIDGVPAGARRVTVTMVLGTRTLDVVVPEDGAVTVDFEVKPL